jgi:hypothetical protein
VDADRQAGPQPEFWALGDADDVGAGAQRVEDAPLADPCEVFWRSGAAEDRQAS